ncbi:MAG: hypothetical protein U0236_02925 [Nitrospira sp.]
MNVFHRVTLHRTVAVWPGWLGGTLLLVTSCASAEHTYLTHATDHATKAEIAQTLGRPDWEQSTGTGDTLWMYQQEGGGTGARDFIPVCQQTWLTFDRDKVLRKWAMQRC